MTTMTLKRATHVFNRIKTETSFQTEVEDAYSGYGRSRHRDRQHNPFTLAINISVDDHVKQQADAYRRLALSKKDRMFGLMEIGTKIRAAMIVQQAKCGVTDLVTTRVMVINKIKVLEHLLEAVETSVLVPDQLERQAEVIRTRLASSTQGTTTANVSTPILNSEDRDDLTRELNGQRSNLMRIDDELETLNVTNQISVNDEDLKVLQEAGLAA